MKKPILPHDNNSEAGVVASLLSKPEMIMHSEILKPDYFYNKEYGSIYWGINELYNKGIQKIDEFNLITQLNSNKGISNMFKNKSDGYIQELIENLTYVKRDTVEEYKNLCNIVSTHAFKRAIYNNIVTFEKRALDVEDTDLNKLNLDFSKSIDSLVIKHTSANDTPLYSDILDSVLETIAERRNADGTYGIPSKFKHLSSFLSYEIGELILYCARRKQGKSVIAMNEMVHKLRAGISCVYFDTEMKDEIFTTRLLSHLSQVEEWKIKTGKMSEAEFLAVEKEKKWIKEEAPPFVHKYEPCWTREMVYTQAKILKNKIDFEFFIYDYIKTTDNNLTSSSEAYNDLGNWCNFLKNDIAGGLNVSVLSMVQLNRNDQIADSDKIERYASAGIKWSKKTPEEIMADGEEYGNCKMNVFFNRLGAVHDEDEYLNYHFDGAKLSIHQCENTPEKVPEFMED